jgi:hypothetical protein
MKNAVFWDINNQFVLHRRHITSPLQSPGRLMLCKISGFHGDDCEECRLLGCDAVWLRTDASRTSKLTFVNNNYTTI